MPFVATPPLDYYYLHGYKIMNQFYRIMAAQPQYKYMVDQALTNGNNVAFNSVITKVLMDLKKDPKGWELMKIDEQMMTAIMQDDASADHRELISALGPGPNVPSERQIMQDYRQQAATRLSDLVDLLEDTKGALQARPRPTGSWVIRGDSVGMVQYLKTQGIAFPDVPPPAGQCYRFDKDWRTNQFFSTSSGDGLASIAGVSLVWIMRIDPARTQGRIGGAYTSEEEVLFPYEVPFQLECGIDVASEGDIGKLNLASFSQPDNLRTKLLGVYRANASRWSGNKARFLVARETS
ncbi:hypothetical protein AB4851_01305 [Burkholderia sp. 22PA0099]|uniref:hypothetical protein n=1 Tax=Burkholderia sp. 22PA0099 TaxID=3237372 RepID=UPI0039C22F1B